MLLPTTDSEREVATSTERSRGTTPSEPNGEVVKRRMTSLLLALGSLMSLVAALGAPIKWGD